MITVVGIKSCDTCRKAMAWLKQQGIPHRFDDLKANGVDAKRLKHWISVYGWEAVLNRRGTTWRQLKDEDKAAVDEGVATLLMMKHPTLIKRPVFEKKNEVLIGFSDDVKATLKAL